MLKTIYGLTRRRNVRRVRQLQLPWYCMPQLSGDLKIDVSSHFARQETASQPNEGSDAQRRCRLHMFQAKLCHLVMSNAAMPRGDQGVTKAWRHSQDFAPLNGTMKPKSSTVASFPTKCNPWPRINHSNEQKDGVLVWDNSAYKHAKTIEKNNREDWFWRRCKGNIQGTREALDATGTEDQVNDENVADDSFSHGHDHWHGRGPTLSDDNEQEMLASSCIHFLRTTFSRRPTQRLSGRNFLTSALARRAWSSDDRDKVWTCRISWGFDGFSNGL